MNVIRSGTKNLIIQSEDCKATFDVLQEKFNVDIYMSKTGDMHKKYLSMIGLLDDKSTVLMLSTKMAPKLSFEYEDFEYLLVIHKRLEEVLVGLLRLKEVAKIKDIRLTPTMIVMRTTGDVEKYIEAVNKDVQGEIISNDDIHEKYGQGTMIIFTNKKIRGPLGPNDFQDKTIYSQKNHGDLIQYLDKRRVKYINASIDNKDWAELSIKIYDSYEQYDLHYQRLAYILNELDCGLILGESWGRDAALSFLSVGIYKIRLFTYLEPKEIKKITLGLEYLENGDRVVDYDIYSKRKKYFWTDVRTDEIKKRDPLGLYYRRRLVDELNEDVLVELRLLEKKINK